MLPHRAYKIISLRVVIKIGRVEEIFLKASFLLLMEVIVLDKGFDLLLLESLIVLFTPVACICYYFNGVTAMLLLKAFKMGD